MIREENSSSILISPEIKRKFEEYVHDNFYSSLILNKDLKEDFVNNKNIFNGKTKIWILKVINFESNNTDYNKKIRNNKNNS